MTRDRALHRAAIEKHGKRGIEIVHHLSEFCYRHFRKSSDRLTQQDTIGILSRRLQSWTCNSLSFWSQRIELERDGGLSNRLKRVSLQVHTDLFQSWSIDPPNYWSLNDYDVCKFISFAWNFPSGIELPVVAANIHHFISGNRPFNGFEYQKMHFMTVKMSIIE
jgi:hypothetical protein